MEFKKALAKFYKTWERDARYSAAYCSQRGFHNRAKLYLDNAEQYAKIIEKNKKAIDFFSIGDNAFLKDSALPEEFRGYK